MQVGHPQSPEKLSRATRAIASGNARSGSRNSYVSQNVCDDTFVVGSGGILPRKMFEIWVSKVAFPALREILSKI